MPRGEKGDEPWNYIYLGVADQASHRRALPRAHDPRRARLPRHPQQRPLHRRRRSRQPPAQHRAGAAALEPGQRRAPRSGSRLPGRFPSCSSISSSSTEADLYKLDGPLSMTHLAPLVANDAFAKLKDRVFQPARDPALPPHADIFEAMRRAGCSAASSLREFRPGRRADRKRRGAIRRCSRSRSRSTGRAAIRRSSRR